MQLAAKPIISSMRFYEKSPIIEMLWKVTNEKVSVTQHNALTGPQFYNIDCKHHLMTWHVSMSTCHFDCKRTTWHIKDMPYCPGGDNSSHCY